MNKPLVSIGVPVYNGEASLDKVLKSLTSQTYKNIEIVVSDNASNDETAKILKTWNKKDERITVFHQKENKGSVFNFNFVFERAHGQFFMWAAHDDSWDKDYVSSCIQVLEKNPQIGLSHTYVQVIQSSGDIISQYSGIPNLSNNPLQRFKNYVTQVYNYKNINALFYGLYRTELLKKVMPLKSCVANDHLLLAKLSLLTKFQVIKKPLMTKQGGGASTSIKRIIEVLPVTNPLYKLAPHFSRDILLVMAVLHSQISIGQRFLLLFWLFIHISSYRLKRVYWKLINYKTKIFVYLFN